MASPTLYLSSDASAPVLSGQVGALEALLYAVLVTGYGSKSGAGWTRPYTGTNKSAFRAGSGLQAYLRIDDTAAQMSRLVGYMSMSDVDTGTGDFPTAAQFSGGLYFRKSTSASSSARGWLIVATDTTFYMFAGGVGAVDAGGGTNFGFGELASYVASDAHKAFIIGAVDTSTSLTNSTADREPLAYFGTSALTGHYLSGDYAQSAGSIACWKRTSNRYNHASSGASGIAGPGPYTGQLHFGRVACVEGSNVIRGTFPGIYAPGHPFSGVGSIPHGMTIEGRGEMSGKTFTSMNNGGVSYCMLLQTGGDWSW